MQTIVQNQSLHLKYIIHLDAFIQQRLTNEEYNKLFTLKTLTNESNLCLLKATTLVLFLH